MSSQASGINKEMIKECGWNALREIGEDLVAQKHRPTIQALPKAMQDELENMGTRLQRMAEGGADV